jgi:hypothetical protein
MLLNEIQIITIVAHNLYIDKSLLRKIIQNLYSKIFNFYLLDSMYKMSDMKQCFIIMIIVVCVCGVSCFNVEFFILLPKQTAFKILNIVQCYLSSTSIKYWPSWTADCRLMFGCIYFVSVSRCSIKCKNMTALTQPSIKLWWSRHHTHKLL